MNAPDSPPIRALHVVWTGRLTGVEMYVLRHLDALGPDQEPYVVTFGQGSFTERLAARGTPHESLDVPSLWTVPVRRWFTAVKRLHAIIRERQIQVVVGHFTRSALTALPAACLAGIPYVQFIHKVHAMPVVDLAISALSTRMVFTAERPRANFRLAYPARTTLLYPCAPADAFDAAPDPALAAIPGPRIGLIAQLIRRKRPFDFVAMAGLLAPRFPDARFLLIGEDPREESESMSERLAEQVRALGLADRVMFTGFRKDIPAVLSALDLVVHTAEEEMLSIALIEAAMAGRPIVAYDVDGLPEVIPDGVTGTLVPVRDVSALAQAAHALLADEPRRRACGEAARTFSRDRFGMAGHRATALALYRDVIASA